MTKGVKTGIVVGTVVLVIGASVLIYKAVNDFKEREVIDQEKAQFGSLGNVVELGRKKQPPLAEWYDNLSSKAKQSIEEGWLVMTEDQRSTIMDGIKKNPMPDNVLNFFKSKGYQG